MVNYLHCQLFFNENDANQFHCFQTDAESLNILIPKTADLCQKKVPFKEVSFPFISMVGRLNCLLTSRGLRGGIALSCEQQIRFRTDRMTHLHINSLIMYQGIYSSNFNWIAMSYVLFEAVFPRGTLRTYQNILILDGGGGGLVW